MKLTKLAFALGVFTLALSACEKETNSCIQSDWIGTYTGTNDCDPNNLSEEIATVQAVGTDRLNIILTDNINSNDTLRLNDVQFDKCNASHTTEQGGTSIEVKLKLEADVLVVQQISGENECSFLYTRQ